MENTTKRSIEIQVPVKLSEEDVSDILSTAFSGGINHWAKHVSPSNNDYKGHDYTSQVLFDNSIKIYTIWGKETQVLTLKKFQRGFTLWINHKLKSVGKSEMRSMLDPDKSVAIYDGYNLSDPGNIDSIEADCIIQFALFGEIIYPKFKKDVQ